MIKGDINTNSFMHPGYIQEDPERLIEIENLNLPSDPKVMKPQNDLIPIEGSTIDKKIIKHNQETSGYFQTKAPDMEQILISSRIHQEKHMDQEQSGEEIKRGSFINGIKQASSLIEEESFKNQGGFRSFFSQKKKFDKIRVYFGQNSSQNDIYQHPNNIVSTTKHI